MGVESGGLATEHRKRRLGTLALTALGIVYGDIGTSPLYAIRECFYGEHGVAPTAANVLGVLSLILWTLVIVVTLKYHVYVIRADNRGEGGILALMALLRRRLRGAARAWLLLVGLFGASLLYADGVLTPAISVLGAMEGLTVLEPGFERLVVPVSVVILAGLFNFQRRGTAGVGAVFGPVMLVWFSTLAVLGIAGIARNPAVLAAVSPVHAVRFLVHGGAAGFLVLGAVFLVATGGEALYADLGHFGERPIQVDWFCLVGVSLTLNYFGQGALVLSDGEAARNPFYLLAPAWSRPLLLVLATMAAVIASQAIISGSFSLTRQAVQLGYLPRFEIAHTSATEIGQIYIPVVNWLLALATVGVVIGFRSSSNVASAYGVALTTTMLITTVLASLVAVKIWRWRPWLAALVTAVFLVPDLSFFGAAMLKIPDGGWFPLAVALGVLALLTSWEKGRAALSSTLVGRIVPLEKLLEDLERRRVPRVAGTAVYLTGDASGTPIALLHNLKINRVVHEKILLLTIVATEDPYVAPAERLEVTAIRSGIYRVVARFGFMEDADVPELLKLPELAALELDPARTFFVLSRNQLVRARLSRIPAWRRWLFLLLSRNSLAAEHFFHLPPNQVLELGMQVEI
jgi:KUP system potassium uptake protein